MVCSHVRLAFRSCGFSGRVFLDMRHRGVAHPRALFPRVDARAQALAIARSIALDHVVELVPVDRSEIIMPALGVPLELRVGHGDAEIVRLRHRLIDEALAELVVREYLDFPLRRLSAVHRRRVGRPEHHQRRPPPSVERVLRHRFLRRGPLTQRHHDVEALTLVKALLLADANHRSRVRPERAPAQRYLIHDRRAVDQPSDGADVGPGQRRIVEDARILGFAGMQIGDELIARNAQRLRGAIKVKAVARFILDLGHEYRFALEARRAGDPVALGQHADDFGVGVLRDLPDQRLAIRLGHPVLGLDLDIGVDSRLEFALLRGELVLRAQALRPGVDHLRVHEALLRLGVTARLAAILEKRYTFCMTMANSVSDRRAATGARPDPALSRWIRQQLVLAPPKAKSLVVTVWGDSIAPHGGALWLSGLIALLEPFGVNERLVRTSVYRLAQEGWLVARQEGRRSLYRLTRQGQRRFEHAYRRIYAPPATDPWDGCWHLVIVPPAAIDESTRRELRKELEWDGFGVLGPGLFARPARPGDERALKETTRALGVSGSVAVVRARSDEIGSVAS